MAIITKEFAEIIAKKLKAEIRSRTGSAHDQAVVSHNGVVIATFGIRRGSRKEQGHDHIPKQIFVSPNFARQMGQCSKSLTDWIAEMMDKGHIPRPAE